MNEAGGMQAVLTILSLLASALGTYLLKSKKPINGDVDARIAAPRSHSTDEWRMIRDQDARRDRDIQDVRQQLANHQMTTNLQITNIHTQIGSMYSRLETLTDSINKLVSIMSTLQGEKTNGH